MTRLITGGCACGALRYSCGERPLAQLICHCRDCQRASGSAFAACLLLPTDRLQFHGGQLKAYAVVSAKGRAIQRSFCPECGSPVAIRRPEMPDVQFVQAASLDNPAIFTPTCEVWVSRAQAWHPYLAETLKFDEGAPPEMLADPIAAYFAARTSQAPSPSPLHPLTQTGTRLE
jgi:hypothetical protein